MQKPQETQIPEEMGRWLWARVWESPEKGPDPATAGVGMGDLARTEGEGTPGHRGMGRQGKQEGSFRGLLPKPGAWCGLLPCRRGEDEGGGRTLEGEAAVSRGPTRWFLAKRRPEKQHITSKLIGRPSPLSICLPFLKKASGTVVWVGKLCVCSTCTGSPAWAAPSSSLQEKPDAPANHQKAKFRTRTLLGALLKNPEPVCFLISSALPLRTLLEPREVLSSLQEWGWGSRM